MGNSGNIIILNGEWQICLYTHHGGADLKTILKAAMTRGKPRWDDPPYLARIIFSEMVKDDLMGTMEFGIQPHIGDNSNDVYVVNIETQSIEVHGKESLDITEFPKGMISFKRFIS